MSSNSTSDLPSASDKNTEPRQKRDPKPKSVDKRPRRRPKFTRGEKCLFSHLVVTFSILILLFIMYCFHLYFVNHGDTSMFANLLRMGSDETQTAYMPVGIVYVLPNSYMCNTLLLRTRWSLAPAHCVAARSDPDLSDILPNWRVKFGMNNGYKSDSEEGYTETQILRSMPHPHFNRDDFQNNIGLFELHDFIRLFAYAYLSDKPLTESMLLSEENELNLLNWEESLHLRGQVVQNPVEAMPLAKCKVYVSPVVDIRLYEYCVTPTMGKRNVSITPGAVLMMNSKYVGIFSWGDSKGQAVPFVIIDIAPYKNWILFVISV